MPAALSLTHTIELIQEIFGLKSEVLSEESLQTSSSAELVKLGPGNKHAGVISFLRLFSRMLLRMNANRVGCII